MKIRVAPEACQGHTLCAMTAPGMFELSEVDGHAEAVAEDVPAAQEELARLAAGSCPEQAVLLSVGAGEQA